MKVVCPSCAKTLKVRDELAGKRVRCPHCGERLAVEAPARQGAPSSAPARSCPECRAAMAPGAIVCVQCGLDTRTGHRVAESLSAAVQARRVRKWRLVKALAVLAIGAVVFGLWYGRHRDEADFAAASQAGTPAAFEAYIAAHPAGRHVDEARDELAFGQAQAKGSREAYLAYLQAFPDGSHRTEATERSHPLHAGRTAEEQGRPLLERLAVYQDLLTGGALAPEHAKAAGQRIAELLADEMAAWAPAACDAFLKGLDGAAHPVFWRLCVLHEDDVGFLEGFGWLARATDVFLHVPRSLVYPMSKAERAVWLEFAARHGRVPVGETLSRKELLRLPIPRIGLSDYHWKTLEKRTVLRVGAKPVGVKAVPYSPRLRISQVRYFAKNDLRKASAGYLRTQVSVERGGRVLWRSAKVESRDPPLDSWTTKPTVCSYNVGGLIMHYRPWVREWDGVVRGPRPGKRKPVPYRHTLPLPTVGTFTHWRGSSALSELRRQVLRIVRDTDVPALKTKSAPLRLTAGAERDLAFVDACASVLLVRGLGRAGRVYRRERDKAVRDIIAYVRKDPANPRLAALVRGRWGPGYKPHE